MKLSISNLAFKTQALQDVLGQLTSYGIGGLEIAPGLIWTDPVVSPVDERRQIRQKVQDEGLTIAALQSVLFERPDLQLFGSSSQRNNMKEYLKQVIDLCHDLGAGVMCFGAYRNRIKGELPLNEAMDIATDFFCELADCAGQADVVVCFEPLSKQYGCDFVHTAGDGAALVEAVDSKNFQLVFDVGNALLDSLDPVSEIRQAQHQIYHIHLNRPKLQAPGIEEQAAIIEVLKEIWYSGYITLEFLSDQCVFDEVLRSVIRSYIE